MSYRVTFLPRAEADVQRMLRYLLERSPQGAAAWHAALEQAVDRLREDPRAFGKAIESEHFQIDVRQVLFKTRRGLIYRLIYTLVEREARILRVRGPGQAQIDPSDLGSNIDR